MTGDTPDSSKPLTLALVRDLLLASQIRLAAERNHAPLRLLRDPALLSDPSFLIEATLIVDLNLPGALQAAAAYKRRTGCDVIAFVSHVDTQTIDLARKQGITHIHARSAFFARLDSLFQ